MHIFRKIAIRIEENGHASVISQPVGSDQGNTVVLFCSTQYYLLFYKTNGIFISPLFIALTDETFKYPKSFVLSAAGHHAHSELH